MLARLLRAERRQFMSEIKVYDLREIAADPKAFEGKEVAVQGWVRNHRKQKNIGFMEFFDGTVLAPMQVVYDENVEGFASVQAIRNGAAVRATGTLVYTHCISHFSDSYFP